MIEKTQPRDKKKQMLCGLVILLFKKLIYLKAFLEVIYYLFLAGGLFLFTTIIC